MDNNMILRTVLIVVAAFVLFALIHYYYNKQTVAKSEKFYQAATTVERFAEPKPAPTLYPTVPSQPVASVVQPSESTGDEVYRGVDYQGTQLPNDCFPKDRSTVEDLLPKDAANLKWAQVNPAGQGDVKDQNFLNAGYMIGINTVGSSLKNANLQLRSEPIIPKVSVGPFLNSTYEASDVLRRPLEIGGDC